LKEALCQKVEETNLDSQQKEQLLELLLCYEDQAVFSLEELGQSATKHDMELVDNPDPIKTKPRRVSAEMQKEIDVELEAML